MDSIERARQLNQGMSEHQLRRPNFTLFHQGKEIASAYDRGNLVKLARDLFRDTYPDTTPDIVNLADSGVAFFAPNQKEAICTIIQSEE